MKIALCQINTIQGDVSGNAARIAGAVRRAADAGARLAVTPELALCGYSPRDLLFRRAFRDMVAEHEARLADALPDGTAYHSICNGGANRCRREPLVWDSVETVTPLSVWC